MEKTTKMRDSGVELLRILTALSVVMLHYNDGRAFKYVEAGSAQQITLFFLESCAICAVDLFILISGYYLSRTQKRSVLKPLELIVEIVIIRLLFLASSLIFEHSAFSLKGLLLCFVPNKYFVILYCALYLISPFLNRVFRKFSGKQWKQFLLIVLLVFSVWNTLVDVLEEVVGSEFMGLSTITAWGSKQGFNIVNFCLLYSIGAYLRCNPTPKNLEKRTVLFAFWLLSVLCIFFWALLCRRFHLLELRSAWMYHNPLVIFSAVLLFLFFRSLSFKSKAINRLSAASFTCYLVHTRLLNFTGINNAVSSSVPYMLAHIVLVLIGIYIAAWIIHEMYHFSTDWLFRILYKLKAFQPIIIGKEED